MITSPPLPPSPPDGPPRGTYFSRRKAMQPLPPSPALTRIFASSINMGSTNPCQKQKPRPEGEAGAASDTSSRPLTRDAITRKRLLRNFHRLDHHELSHRALFQELDTFRDLCKQPVVFAAAHVQARPYARAAFPAAEP